MNGDEFEKQFRAEGFLAPGMEELAAVFRRQNAVWLAFARRLNSLAQDLYADSTLTLIDQSIKAPSSIGLQMAPRALAAFQGAIILAERGMNAEALTLTRGIYECGFWMAFLHAEPDTAVKAIFFDEVCAQLGRDQASLAAVPLDAATRRVIEARVAEGKTAKERDRKHKKSMEDVAKGGGNAAAFPFWKELTGDSAHVSLSSIFPYLARHPDGGVAGHKIGPDENEIERSLVLACSSLMIVVEAVRHLADQSQHDERWRGLIDEFEKLGREDA